MSGTSDPAKIQMSGNAIIIDDSNVNSGKILREKKLLNNPNLWHNIIVECPEKLSRDIILKAILDDVQLLDLIPVAFTLEGTTASFFARNCRMAIEKLCRQNLIVANPYNNNKPFKLKIILAYTNTTDFVVNVQDNVSSVLNKRFQTNTRMMNLDNFCKDPDLKEFCALSQPKILYFVLHLSKQYSINSLKLSNNDIHTLSPIESIWGMKSLTTLDLRNNLIEKMSELTILKSMQIKELFLDGNPLCDNYDEFSYIQAVREVCPKVEKLDGVILGQKGFLPFRRNYLCNIEGQDLIDQFLDHYFTLYDNNSQSSLCDLYAKNALFSVTCHYLPGHASSSSTNLTPYKRNSRNLKLLSDLSKNSENLFIGGPNIIQMLKRLPLLEHDPYSFTIDMVLYMVNHCIVTITGIFREPARSVLEAEKVFGFARTFVLKAGGNNEYNIINDLLHISNATTAQQQRAFKIVRVPRITPVKIEVPSTNKEKKEMEEGFKAITTLNTFWSRKCLEECNYDMAKALLLFVDLHKVDRIPQEAFVL